MSDNLPNMVRKFSLSPSTTSNDCLDLSVRGLYIIVYFPHTLPGSEYEILSSNELEDSSEHLNIGTKIFSQLGNDRIQGEVIALSEKRSDLTLHFNSITTRHRQGLEENLRELSRNVQSLSERRIIKIAHAESQTETDHDEHEWMRKCEELEGEIEMVYSSLSVLGNQMNISSNNLNVTISDNSYTSTLSTTYYSSDDDGNFRHSENFTSGARSSSNGNEEDKPMVKIGSNGTAIPKRVFDGINWSSYTAATRKLLVTLFSREVLATHSLTGKPSPAFLNSDKQQKIRLDPRITSDIIELVSQKCNVSESQVRYSITTKCADENKLYRQRQRKRKKVVEDEYDYLKQDDDKKGNIRC